MILPADFGLPALPYLATLVVGAAAVSVALYRRRPPVTAATVTALASWIAGGGALYALYQVGLPPEPIAPFFGSPAVYVSVGIVAGAVLAAVADRPGDTWDVNGAPALVAGSGGALLGVALVAAAIGVVTGGGGTVPLVSAGILVASVGVSALAWAVLRRLRGPSPTKTVGLLAVFGHTLDGISTAVGYDFLGFGEQTPLSRLIIEAGGALPTAELIGSAWLFTLVKIALGLVVVVLFEEYVRADPAEGYLLLGLVVAVGLGPGFHNLVLFALV